MGKAKNIFKPDRQAIIQNLYANFIWWAIPILGGVVLRVWNKSNDILSGFYSWIAQMNTPEIVKLVIGIIIPILGFAVIIWIILWSIRKILRKQKTLKRVFANIKHDNRRIYILIENKECRIDINCTNITVYKVNSLDSNHTIPYSDIEDAFNSFFALGDKILTPYARIKDVIIPVNHKDKNELDLLTINSSENQLEFKTITQRNPLNPGLYRLVLGFTVYPQREGYKDFDIYISARIDYHGGSDLELWELRNARTKE